MAWRLWGRETFCCAPDHIFPPRWSFGHRLSNDCESEPPALSSSVESDSSKSESAVTTTSTSRSNSSSSRHSLRRQDSTSRGKEKHLTPVDLEKVVNSIQEKKELEPLSPLPLQLSQTLPPQQLNAIQDTTPRPSSSPRTRPQPARFVPESSSSTVATALGSDGMSPAMASDVTASTDLSSHSIVHGFVPGRVSTIQSSTNLKSHPALKPAALQRTEPAKIEPAKKKAAKFTLGGSSDEDNASSFEASMCLAKQRSSLSDALRRPGLNKKTTSFKDEVMLRTIKDAITSEESAIDDTSEEEESDGDDNAIDDSDDDDWEDDDNSGPSSVNEKEMFQRVESRSNLTSHRSLLTDMMHEGDRRQALLNAASRSTSHIRRSRASSPNGPSTGNSPPEDLGLMMRQQNTRSKPIIMTTSNMHPPALSPRTTRRNMLQTELTESLRKNLLWERQQKNATTNAAKQRLAAAGPGLRRAATTSDIKNLPSRESIAKTAGYPNINKTNNSMTDYFDQGLQEYHQKGW
ncbi:DUF1752-domain-containing protein [Delitschia confertaspora ATCC 74209]|uniref:DUF1752-domain-containing protein n=1 Tax=Delitschia confertaspora ATCC 74209 TaxID=1513339 RepID=A0A9P4JTE3_9PLEO|nr:DUF1752-domain-containing protein [Delitschia confertaspora ATCC 74209]